MYSAPDHIRDAYLIVFMLGFISLVWFGALVVVGIIYLESLTKGKSAKEE